MKVRKTDIDTDYLTAALEELYSNSAMQYGALSYIACCVVAGDRQNGLGQLKKLVARGKEIVESRQNKGGSRNDLCSG